MLQFFHSTLKLFTIFFLTLIFVNPLPIYADQSDPHDIESFKFIPKFLCIYFKLDNCDVINANPDSSTTPPIYPTPELLQTPAPAKPGSCAQPGGEYVCGSRAYPLADCGHCGIGYPPSQQGANCDDGKDETWGTAYAIDITLKPYQSIFLPTIEGQNVTWTFYAERKYPNNAIQRYRGIANNKTYVVQFHHTLIGSGIGIGKTAISGEIGAKLCPSCDHTHIQIMQGTNWKSATSFYCTQK